MREFPKYDIDTASALFAGVALRFATAQQICDTARDFLKARNANTLSH